ncbi:hypothetical protein UFOVP435_74 [uncultured Caudovirales phage]|uniref:Uncharacterized protein n=1 Tax=uncultured Caudovirales phage TaxID=2100421 RepID=A0A6J5M938_9CAUD|nr:hypothetical protein UFOVP435_74 [uncultured Caudovirales phage]
MAQRAVAAKPSSKKALPMTLGAAVDLLYERRQARIVMARQHEEAITVLKDAEQEAEEHIMNLLASQDLQSARGALATATVVPKEVPKVEDWNAFYKFMFKKQDGALLQKRLAVTHLAEVWQDLKGKVPGVSMLKIKELSLTKAAGPKD